MDETSGRRHDDEGVHRCDVAVLGGGAAGLAAALLLGRSRRSVVVIDAGEPRNAPAAHMHGYLGHDGAPPTELLSIGRAEVRRYGVEVMERCRGEVTRLETGHFRVEVSNGAVVVARRIVVATGLIDVLPDVPGLAAHWGRGAIHCPYCHGWEVRDQALVVIDTGFGAHQAALFRQVTSDLTLVVHTGDGPDDDAVARLAARGVRVVREQVAEVLSGGGGDVVGVRLVGGSVIPAAAVVVGPRVVARTAGVTGLGLASVPDAMGVGEVIETDPAGKTAVAGVYAAGNVADVKGQVLQAAAAGAVVGATVNADLVAEDTDDALERDTAAHEWDERYLARAHLGSDRPGEELVARASRLAPGRALDVGCGEGTDARWLASKGWETTGLDVSQVALDRAAALAGDAGVAVGWVCGDLTTAALDDRGYDLVAVRDPHLRRTDDGAVETALVGAVAPGGTLVFVGHASLDPERARPHGFDPADHVQPADIVARLDETWDVLVDETRPRVTASPHDGPWTHDAVLSVRRHPRG